MKKRAKKKPRPARRRATPKPQPVTASTVQAPMLAVDHAQIADLLSQSRAAHQDYRANIMRRVNGEVVEGNPQQAGAALLLAIRTRTEAHALDPQREAPAWKDEPATHDHDALLDFYADQLSR